MFQWRPRKSELWINSSFYYSKSSKRSWAKQNCKTRATNSRKANRTSAAAKRHLPIQDWQTFFARLLSTKVWRSLLGKFEMPTLANSFRISAQSWSCSTGLAKNIRSAGGSSSSSEFFDCKLRSLFRKACKNSAAPLPLASSSSVGVGVCEKCAAPRNWSRVLQNSPSAYFLEMRSWRSSSFDGAKKSFFFLGRNFLSSFPLRWNAETAATLHALLIQSCQMANNF